MKNNYKPQVLWSRGYFVSTVGHISEAAVKKYIEEQKDHE